MDLMQAFNFTSEDLEANRLGYLSKAQRVRLRKNSHEGLRLFGFLLRRLSVAVIVPTLLIKIIFPADDKMLIAVLMMSGCIAGFILCLVGLAYVATRDGETIDHDLKKGDVKFVCGQAFLDVPDKVKGKSPRTLHRRFEYFYTLEVNGVRFPLPERYWAPLLDLDRRPVCVYYTPNSRVILSIEETA